MAALNKAYDDDDDDDDDEITYFRVRWKKPTFEPSLVYRTKNQELKPTEQSKNGKRSD